MSPLPEPGVEAADRVNDLGPVLDEELSRLPEKYSLPLILCELEGRSRREVARHLKLPEGTLSSRLATARKLLARRLTRRGAAPCGASVTALLGGQRALADVPSPVLSSTVEA